MEVGCTSILLKEGSIVLINVGRKRRPACVIKDLGEIVLVVPLTTDNNELSSKEYNSPLLGKGYFTNQVITITKEYALNNSIGHGFDNPQLVKNIKTELLTFLTENLND